MSDPIFRLNLPDTMKQVTFHVKLVGGQRVKWRLKIASKFIKLAAWIAGVGGVKVEGFDES